MMCLLKKIVKIVNDIRLSFMFLFSALSLLVIVAVGSQESTISEESSRNTETLTVPEENSNDTRTVLDVQKIKVSDDKKGDGETMLVKSGTEAHIPSFYSKGNTTYARSNTKIKFSALERLSKVSKIQYKIDGSAYKNYLKPFTIEEQGRHQIFYRSFDIVGNVESENVVIVIVDDKPPVVSFGSNVTFTKFKDEFFVSSANNPQLYIKATDSYSGVRVIEYYIEGSDGTPDRFSIYSSGIPLDIQGEKVVVYRAIDNLGNISESKKIKITTDVTSPTIKISFKKKLAELDGNKYSPKNNELILEATDKESGVALIYVKLGADESFRLYSESIPIKEDKEYKIEAKSVDRTGNESIIAKESVVVDVDPPKTSLEFLTDKDSSRSSEEANAPFVEKQIKESATADEDQKMIPTN